MEREYKSHLEKILKTYKIRSCQLSEKSGCSSNSISHFLKERNKITKKTKKLLILSLREIVEETKRNMELLEQELEKWEKDDNS